MPATYALSPGGSVGPFLLGDSLWHVLDILRTEKRSYPKVELAWDTSKAHISDLTITLPNIILYFPHPSQRLARLEIRDIPQSTLTLSYESHVLRSPTQALTRGLVGRVLGPTYSGDGGVLSYPGIRLAGPSSSGSSSNTRDEKIESIAILAKEEEVLPLVISLTKAIVHPNRGVTLHMPHPVEILISQTTAQDILLDLGAPLRKFVKEDDRMERIWGDHASTDTSATDNKGIYWNYFQHGLDILISPDHVVSKIILHSNIPGTALFQTHARCPWSLSTSSGSFDHSSPLSSFKAYFNGESTQPVDEVNLTVPSPTPPPSSGSTSGKKKNKKGNSGPSSFTDAGEIMEARVRSTNGAAGKTTKDSDSDGMILDRVVEGGLDGVEEMSPSRLVGFKGLILEEDIASGGISSVLVFQQL